MKKMITRAKMQGRIVFLALAAAISLTACASSPRSGGEKNPYYDSNIHDFSSSRLSNGIPVIFKQQAGKTAWLGLVISGGVAFYPPEKSGLEDITLSLMLHGSEAYSYKDIQQLQFEKSFSLQSSAGKDYSLLSTHCISRDIESATKLLADSVLHPLLTQEDFTTVMTEAGESLQRTLSSPSGVLGLELAKSAFASHPYASSTGVTEESIQTLTLEDVRKHHTSLLNAKRLSFVLVGDFTGKTKKNILALLESSFASLPGEAFSQPELAPLKAASGAIYSPCAVAGDTGYIAGYFACPDRKSDDYVAFALALMYLDDILFKQVREEAGAVYSIGTGVLGGRALLGAISLYKATEKKNLKGLVMRAIDSFPSEEDIEKTLDRYKNKYITTLFQSSQHIGGVAGNVVASLAYYGDPARYLNRSAQVQKVTAADVTRVYRRYLAQSQERSEDGKVNPICWIVVSGQEALQDFAFN